jgi:hypothetical protein
MASGFLVRHLADVSKGAIKAGSTDASPRRSRTHEMTKLPRVSKSGSYFGHNPSVAGL